VIVDKWRGFVWRARRRGCRQRVLVACDNYAYLVPFGLTWRRCAAPPVPPIRI